MEQFQELKTNLEKLVFMFQKYDAITSQILNISIINECIKKIISNLENILIHTSLAHDIILQDELTDAYNILIMYDNYEKDGFSNDDELINFVQTIFNLYNFTSHNF